MQRRLRMLLIGIVRNPGGLPKQLGLTRRIVVRSNEGYKQGNYSIVVTCIIPTKILMTLLTKSHEPPGPGSHTHSSNSPRPLHSPTWSWISNPRNLEPRILSLKAKKNTCDCSLRPKPYPQLIPKLQAKHH